MKTKRNHLPNWIWRRPDALLACGLGTGAATYAPGTFGTLLGLPLFWLMSDLSLPLYISICVVLFIFGIWICGRTADALGVHDHSGIVWDEVVGYLITMMLAPPGWLAMLVGFVLFRLFDIVKPWPISVLDRRVTGGLGIMLDDVLAGLYAFIILQLLVASAIWPG